MKKKFNGSALEDDLSEDSDNENYVANEDFERDSLIESEEEEEFRQLQESSEETSSEEEVFGIHSDTDISDSEVEDNDKQNEHNLIDDSDLDVKENDLPNTKAWGKKRSVFYNSDYVTKTSRFKNEDDEEAAEMEEREAMSIQKRLASQIDDADLFDFDIEDEKLHKEEGVEKETIEVDLSNISEQEKIKLLKKQSPELMIYINDFKEQLSWLKNEFYPNDINIKNESALNTAHTIHDLITTYCTNILFYLVLKASRTSTEDHPVLKRLQEYKLLLNKLKAAYKDTVIPLIEGCTKLESLKRKEESGSFTAKKLKPMEILHLEKETGNKFKHSEIFQHIEEAKGGVLEQEKEIDAKRGITYQIAKNKGLTPRRKKEQRNPRVRLRNKYRKAKIRRKGQIREVRKEIKRYGGEISGINPHVCRSIKLKY